MNENLRTQIAVTLGCNLFIIVPAGHGLGFLALIEGAFLLSGNYDLSFSTNGYEGGLGLASSFSFVGQIILVGSFFVKSQMTLARVIIAGLIALLLGFFFLTYQSLNGDILAITSFATGVPFIITSIILVVKLMRQPLEGGDSNE